MTDQITHLWKKLNKPIVLVGLMGAGKTTLGTELAKQLRGGFIDSDEVIVEREQRSISDIFKENGEAYFRQVERDALVDLMQVGPETCEINGHLVIATGGGAFMNEETRAEIKELGISVFLKADLDTLVQRVGDGAGRPLFEGKDVREVLADLKGKRYPVYAEADITVPTYDEPIQETTDRVIEALYKHSLG